MRPQRKRGQTAMLRRDAEARQARGSRGGLAPSTLADSHNKAKCGDVCRRGDNVAPGPFCQGRPSPPLKSPKLKVSYTCPDDCNRTHKTCTRKGLRNCRPLPHNCGQAPLRTRLSQSPIRSATRKRKCVLQPCAQIPPEGPAPKVRRRKIRHLSSRRTFRRETYP